jgi:hypothetical protein
MQVGVQRGNDRRRRQHGEPQTRAGQPEQEEGDRALGDDGSLGCWRLWIGVAAACATLK